MKSGEKLKITESDAIKALRAAVATIPFVRILREAPSPDGPIDAEVELAVDGEGSWIFLLDHTSRPEPKYIRQKAETLLLAVKDREESGRADGVYGVLAGSWFSPEAIKLCRSLGIGCIDGKGNCLLSFRTVHIEVGGRPNPAKRKLSRLDISKPKSACVVRTLLSNALLAADHYRIWKVVELAAKCGVSVGTVSKVRTRLLEKDWAVEEARGFFLTQPDALLKAWVAEDDWGKRTEVREYSLLESDAVKIATASSKVLYSQSILCAFTQWFAGWLRVPYTIPPVVSIYVTRFPDEDLLQRELGARRVAPGAGRLRLVVPSDFRGIVSDGRNIGDFYVVSDVQIYLDLLGAGQRADEQAEELRKANDFSGGWK